MRSLKLYFLGPPRIEVDGASADIQRHKALAMLAYLAVTGEDQQRDTLATLFWPYSAQGRARASLRRDLSELNKALGEGWLVAEQDAVGLHNAEIWLDVTQFQSHLAECDQPGRFAGNCVPRLKEAVELYRDDFLAGFTLPDCPDFDDWQFFQTETLRQALSRSEAYG